VGIFTTTDAMRVVRSYIAGKQVDPLVKPTHVTEPTEEGDGGSHAHLRVPRPSRYEGMVSWFLAEI
jgi:hypothetical protein